MNTTVAVAGGGPVGLATAAFLEAAGVRTEVFERNTEPSRHSKAITVHPRTLEALAPLRTGGGRQLTEELIELGRATRWAHFALLSGLLDYSGLPTPYPYVLMVPQAVTERVLAGLLRERGVPVHYGREVTGFEQHADGVRVRLGDGSVREARYLVGADGGHSTVRRLAGIDFPGDPPSALGFVADVELDQPPSGVQHLWFHETGSVSVVPLPGDAFRVFGIDRADTSLAADVIRARQAQPLTLDELRATMVRIAGTDFGLRTAQWLSRSSDSTRRAARYRVGRVLLAGDAAHVHLPAGGQGLNVGLQDAANLAWKLAAEIHGWATPALVDGDLGYDRERRPVAERLAANTLAQGALMHNFTPAGAALRALFHDLIERDGDAARELTGWLSGLGLSYPQPDGAHPLDGTRAPDLSLEGGTLLGTLRPDRFLLADFTADHAFAAQAGPRVEVRRAKPDPGAWSALDAVLVRPDGYVACAADASAGPDGIATALRRWIGGPSRTVDG
ncbi:FAD-dependent monooxygenase [Kitasatospora sp. NPDC052896]|uniref:FAD-dependent monooxygenase n=1 Tax=Kitasatospora sp. NPDC052896 TaxID=3364061 RepID=UPI0037C7F53B